MTGTRFLSSLEKVLALIAAALGIIIVAGTVIHFALGHNSPSENLRKADPAPQKVINLSKRSGDQLDAYTELTQIRAVTKPSSENGSGTLVIISPWFSYPAGDTVLYEELSQKDRQEKSIITEYFAKYTAEELHKKGEQTVKTELTNLINEQLVLGKIRGVYFSEYIFFE